MAVLREQQGSGCRVVIEGDKRRPPFLIYQTRFIRRAVYRSEPPLRFPAVCLVCLPPPKQSFLNLQEDRSAYNVFCSLCLPFKDWKCSPRFSPRTREKTKISVYRETATRLAVSAVRFQTLPETVTVKQERGWVLWVSRFKKNKTKKKPPINFIHFFSGIFVRIWKQRLNPQFVVLNNSMGWFLFKFSSQCISFLYSRCPRCISALFLESLISSWDSLCHASAPSSTLSTHIDMWRGWWKVYVCVWGREGERLSEVFCNGESQYYF